MSASSLELGISHSSPSSGSYMFPPIPPQCSLSLRRGSGNVLFRAESLTATVLSILGNNKSEFTKIGYKDRILLLRLRKAFVQGYKKTFRRHFDAMSI